MVVASLYLLLFMVRRGFAGRDWCVRCPPHERLAERKARGQSQGVDWLRRKPMNTWLSGQGCPGRIKFFFWTGRGPFSFLKKKMGGGAPRRVGILVGTSCASVAPPQAAEFPRCAVPPLPTGPAALGSGGGPSLSPWLAIKRKLPRPAGQGSPFPILILSGCLCGQPDSPGTHGRGRRSG